MGVLRSIATPLRHEIDKIKGSRFVAHVGRVRSEDEARAFVDAVRAALPGATHHASAWRLDPASTACSDDGEVSGTAGRPLLARLEGADLQQVVLVVTRFYGGTKLGKGGLVRAYGQAASEALELAGVVEEIETTTVRVRCDYTLAGPLEGLAIREGAELVDQQFTDAVVLVLAVPVERVDDLVAALGERSAGRAEITRG